MAQQELLEEFKATASELKQHYDYTPEQLLDLLTHSKGVPATVFSTDLSPLQAIVTYLHDHDKECFASIAKHLHRSYRAVWGAYQHRDVTVAATRYTIPLDCFDDKKSVLETVVHHLRTAHKLKFTEIARILDKDSRTVWTAWHRAEKKDGTDR